MRRSGLVAWFELEYAMVVAFVGIFLQAISRLDKHQKAI